MSVQEGNFQNSVPSYPPPPDGKRSSCVVLSAALLFIHPVLALSVLEL